MRDIQMHTVFCLKFAFIFTFHFLILKKYVHKQDISPNYKDV